MPDTPLTPRVERLEERVDSLERSVNDFRVDNAKNFATMAERQSTIFNTLKDIKENADKRDAKLEKTLEDFEKSLENIDRKENDKKAMWYDKLIWQGVLFILGIVSGVLMKYFS